MSDEKKLDKLKKESWYGEKPYYDLSSPQTEEVQIIPDKKISPGMFKPDKDITNKYYAHPTTIKALKKNIFLAGENWDQDVSNIQIECSGCKRKLDKDFWHFCPFCETKFNQ